MAKADGKAPAGQVTKKTKLLPGKKKGKKEKDTFDWRDDKRPSTEPKMLPGGHKNMKRLWISRHEKEQEEASNAAAQPPVQDTTSEEQLQTTSDDRNGGAAPQSSPGDKAPTSDRTSKQGSHAAAVHAAADSARVQAELELRNDAELRAKQHVEDSTAREGVQLRPAKFIKSPTDTAPPPPYSHMERLGKRRPPLAEPPKKRRREALLDVPGSMSPPGRDADQPATQQQQQPQQQPQQSMPSHTPDLQANPSQPHARSMRLAQARLRDAQPLEVRDTAQRLQPSHGDRGYSKEAKAAPQTEPDSTSGAGQPPEQGTGRNAEVSSPRHAHDRRREQQDITRIPVDLMDAAGRSSPLGELDLSKSDSLSALIETVKEGWASKLPNTEHFKLVYQDKDGDLLLMQASEPWSAIMADALRIIIACK